MMSTARFSLKKHKNSCTSVVWVTFSTRWHHEHNGYDTLDSSQLSFRGKYFKPYAQPIQGSGSLIKSMVTKEIFVQQVPQYFDFSTPFSLHLYEIFPDLIKIAKSLTNAYLPPPGVIVVKLVWEVIEQIPKNSIRWDKAATIQDILWGRAPGYLTLIF